ncbi:toxin TcdB middle/N-terminal domain-containing protein [Microbacterium sp. B2969]|uniref:Toxin TcdB middle/N-terminal domain-containing protein n=1 Tax=Microbacterium alkaliflavum TaxID=3248839 RepID=A0ABW7Q5L7_9MICO
MREDTGVAPGLTDVPGGGGGISPLGDRFQPDLVRGTGNYAVPLKLPKGPNDLQPQVSVTYSTGAGNGPFGLGWRYEPLRIDRRSDRGAPAYDDSDTFTLGGAETLVPVGGGRFRPRTDTQSWLIERDGDGWRIRDGKGGTRRLGITSTTRETGPAGAVFAWLLEEETDAAGNSIRYTYEADGGRLWLTKVEWSVFALLFHHETRADASTDRRAGFARTLTRRVTSIDLVSERADPTRLRTWEFEYVAAANGVSLLHRVELSAGEGPDRVAEPALTFEYTPFDVANADVVALPALIPPPGLDQPGTMLADLDGDGVPEVLSITAGSALRWRRANGAYDGPFPVGDLPASVSLTRANVALADLDGDGRVDLFATDQRLSMWFHADGSGGFDPSPQLFAERPSVRLDAPDTRLTDVDGDGVTDVLWTGRDATVVFRLGADGMVEPPVVLGSGADRPSALFGERGVRLADMTGDGLQDLISVRSGQVVYWPSNGDASFDDAVDMASPPVLPPGYRDERLHVVDIDGDGCADVVYLGDTVTTVWINQSGLRFAPPVELPIAPPAGRRALVADLLGDGRPGFAWTVPQRDAQDSGIRLLRFAAGGTAPRLLTAIDNGMGGAYRMAYATTTSMREADEASGAPWSSLLPMVVNVVASLTELDAVSGRESTSTMSYHDGVYDGWNREFRGFRRVSVDQAGDDSMPATRQEVEFFQGEPDELDLVERERQRALAGSLTATSGRTRVGEAWIDRNRSTQTWDARLEHDGGANASVWFPHVVRIETTELAGPAGGPDRVEVTELSSFDAHGHPTLRTRTAFASDAPGDALRSQERLAYVADEAHWLVHLPSRSVMLDADGIVNSARITHYDGAPFVGLPEGQATSGLVTSVLEARLLDSRLPADYAGGRDFAALGYLRLDGGDTAGWYARTYSARRDGHGNVLEQHDPMGAAMVFAYDADSLFPVTTVDALGRVCTTTFDLRSCEPAETLMPDGRGTRAEFDALGRLIAQSETDDSGAWQLVKAWVTDTASVPASMTSFSVLETGLTREELLAVDPLTTTAAGVARTFLDGFGAKAATVAVAPAAADGSARTSVTDRRVVNTRGLVAAALAPEFGATLAWPGRPAIVPASAVRTVYDGDALVLESHGPSEAGFMVERTPFTVVHRDPAAAGAVLRTEHFDAHGRLAQLDSVAAPGHIITTRYDLELDGRITALREGGGPAQAAWVHAGPGEPIRITQADAGTRTYYRDAAGRLVERVDPDGTSLRFSFDALGRVTAIDHHAPTGDTRLRTVHYDVDPDAAHPAAGRFLEGRVAVVDEGDVRCRYSYDHAGRPVREEWNVDADTMAVTRTYDRQGQLASVAYPDGNSVAYERHASGAVTRVVGVADDIEHAADGQVLAWRAANGVRIELTRDEIGQRITRRRAVDAGGVELRSLGYGFDAIGAVTSVSDAGSFGAEHHEYAYDGLRRLTAATVRDGGPGGAVLRQHAYAYDDRGNLTSFDESTPLTLGYADAVHPNRVTAVSSGGGPATAVSYGERGEIVAGFGLSAVALDPQMRLTTATRGDGAVMRVAYDPQNREVRRTVTHADGSVSTTLTAAGLWTRHDERTTCRIYLESTLIASIETTNGAAERTYHLLDHLGSVVLATDSSGAEVESQRMNPFGSALDPNSASLFLGREMEAGFGIVPLGARFYLPSIGRFLSPDWYVLEHPNKAVRLPQGFNVYSYALNNPIAFKDPSGLWFGIDDLIVLAAGFVVGFVGGLIYGLANGQGWGSLLTALETGLTTAAGAWLGWTVAGPIGLVMGGMNGFVGGIHGIYDWSSPSGWFAFLSDSTWSLIGTSLGNIVHIINLFYSDANYRDDLSRRQNRHVYEGGFALKKDFAFTEGNVISNAGLGTHSVDTSFIANHEELHIWQQRFFGPIFQGGYIVWAVGGFIVGSIAWFWHTDQSYGSFIETAAYYDNPFEYWAYKNDNNWPPSGANPSIRW